MPTGLLIGDAHAYPGTSNDRFLWAGRCAADLGVQFVWSAGDWFDMPSLFGVEKSRLRPAVVAGHTYDRDLEAGVEALDLFNTGLEGFETKKHASLGNHEQRIERAVEADPSMEGSMSYDDLCMAEYGWRTYEYLEPAIIHGCVFSHAFKAPGAKNPIGGKTADRRILAEFQSPRSRFRGHDHRFSLLEMGNAFDGGLTTSVSVGCYFDTRGAAHRWAGYDVESWRSGLLWVDVYQGRLRGFRWYPMAEIKANYGG